MKTQLKTLSFLLLGLLLYGPAKTQSTDFPGWRGVNRDGRVSGFVSPTEWPNELTKIWEVPVGLGDASPVFVEGRIYLITSIDSVETILCLDAKKGKEIWRTPVNKAPKVTGGASTHPGPRSTPYVYDGKIFTLGAGGVVACHDIKKGKLIWKNEEYTGEVPQFFTSSSPLLVGQLCIYPLGGKEKGCVVAFDTNTGAQVWKSTGYPTTYSSPVFINLGGAVIVHQAENALVGIMLDGSILGDIPTPGQQRFYNSSTPVVDGQDIYVAGAGTGMHKYRVNLDGGPAVEEMWVNKDISVSFNTPVLKDGFLYASESRFGYLYCVNAETGATAWADTVKLNRFASTLDLGNVMLNLAGNARLTFFSPDPSAYKMLARYTVSDTEIYAHPLVIGDKIYIKDKEKLTCWAVK